MAFQKIVSGGQTGADRAALDWAIEQGVLHGGWCPKGRRAEDGRLPDRYQLQETPSRSYRQRTAWNVRDSDATLIVTLTASLTGGSLLTQQCATRTNKPCLHLFPHPEWQDQLSAFVKRQRIGVLNVAGPRASSAPGIESFVHTVLNQLNASSTDPIHEHL